MQTIKAFLIRNLTRIFGIHYKVRASAFCLALLTSLIDYWASGGKMTPPLLAAVWLGAAKSFFTKSVDVTGTGVNASAPDASALNASALNATAPKQLPLDTSN